MPIALLGIENIDMNRSLADHMNLYWYTDIRETVFSIPFSRGSGKEENGLDLKRVCVA